MTFLNLFVTSGKRQDVLIGMFLSLKCMRTVRGIFMALCQVSPDWPVLKVCLILVCLFLCYWFVTNIINGQNMLENLVFALLALFAIPFLVVFM